VSKRAERRRACLGKRRLPSEEIAERVARLMSRRTASLLLAYHCRWCGRWHVGHPCRRVRESYYARRREHAQQGAYHV
jgi:hypothetical protein